MRPLGTPPTPRAVSRAGLPVEITAVTGGGPSKVLATPAPRRRSTSSSAAARSWVGAAPGGGASWTVAVGMGVGLLCGRRDPVASQTADGLARDGGPVALALALGSAVPTRLSGPHLLPVPYAAPGWRPGWLDAAQAGQIGLVEAEAGDQHRPPRRAHLRGVGGAVVAA